MSDTLRAGSVILDHMIVAGERTLAEFKSNSLLSVNEVSRFEGLIAELYCQRRIYLEDMMQLTFTWHGDIDS